MGSWAVVAEMAVGGSAYDVATIDVVWIPAFADFAEPLDELFTDDVVADIFPALLADGIWNGSYIGMPTWANAEVIYYRKDLWESADEQAAFQAEYGYELAPPTNWQEFTDMATFFTRDTDGDGNIDLYGTDVKGAPPGADVEWMVHVLQAGSPGVVLAADGSIIVDNEAHLAGLEYYVSHHCELGLTPANPLEIDWAAGEALFFQGATAMTRFWGHAYRLQQFDLSGGLVIAAYVGPEKVANVGVAPMIAGEAGIGAIPGPWFNIIPQSSENKEAAKAFVKFMYDQNVLGVQEPLGLSARISAFEQFAGEENYESLTALIATLNRPQTLGRPLVADWQQISDEVVVPMVQDARMVPYIAIAIPLFAMMKTFGLSDSWFAVALAHTTISLPLAIWLLAGFLEAVPPELEDAARVDGCSRLSALPRVIIPVAAGGIVVSAIFCFLASWNEFLYALLLTSVKAKTAPIIIAEFKTQYSLDWGPMTAIGTLYSLPVILFSLFMQRRIVAGMTMGAVKG